MQKIDLRNKSYEQFLIKNESGAVTRNFINNIFFKFKLFFSSSSSF